MIALGTPGFGPPKVDNTPPLTGNGGCTDDLEDGYTGHDWGDNDPFRSFRQPPDLLRKDDIPDGFEVFVI